VVAEPHKEAVAVKGVLVEAVTSKAVAAIVHRVEEMDAVFRAEVSTGIGRRRSRQEILASLPQLKTQIIP
jgi:hypothetical protein